MLCAVQDFRGIVAHNAPVHIKIPIFCMKWHLGRAFGLRCTGANDVKAMRESGVQAAWLVAAAAKSLCRTIYFFPNLFIILIFAFARFCPSSAACSHSHSRLPRASRAVLVTAVHFCWLQCVPTKQNNTFMQVLMIWLTVFLIFKCLKLPSTKHQPFNVTKPRQLRSAAQRRANP